MALAYRTKTGETLDYICWKVYGATSGVLEQVLEANYGLAAFGPVLPEGTLVNLPDMRKPQAQDQRGLW